MLTDQQIIDQTNQLALKFYRLKHPHTPDGLEFQHAEGKKEQKAWLTASIAQEFLCGVNVEEALDRLEGAETLYGWSKYAFYYRSVEDLACCREGVVKVGDKYLSGRFIGGQYVEGSIKTHSITEEDLK